MRGDGDGYGEGRRWCVKWQAAKRGDWIGLDGMGNG